jgi:hypothetical protein
MNVIGWLFLFMRDFEDTSVLTSLGGYSESWCHSEKSVEPLAHLPFEQIVAVREFFELIAKWEEEESSWRLKSS